MTAKKTREPETPAPAPDFESALQRLQDIVKAMEEGELSLEKMMEYFEEGRRLAAFCNRKLGEVERKIETLLKKGDAWTTEPFEPEADRADPAKPGGDLFS